MKKNHVDRFAFKGFFQGFKGMRSQLIVPIQEQNIVSRGLAKPGIAGGGYPGVFLVDHVDAGILFRGPVTELSLIHI